MRLFLLERGFMSGFIPFTDEQKEKARRTDLAGLLRSQGETLHKSGSELEWLDGSQKVTIRGNLWFHQYEQVGGDSIDFVRKFYHKSYPEAMEYLLGQSGGVLSVLPQVQKSAPKFELPPANDNMRRVFAYLLNRRGIDKEVLYAFVHKKMIYESAQYHNVVFVGFDKNGTPRHANKRELARPPLTRATRWGVYLNTVFTGMAGATGYICSRPP